MRATSSHNACDFRVGEKDPDLLRAIEKSKVFIDFQRAFTETTGLPVALRPVLSFQLSFQDDKNQAPFCSLVAQANRTCSGCLQMQAQLAQNGTQTPNTTACYAGLRETVVPVRLGNRLIGYLWTGQVFAQTPTERQFQKTLKLLRTWGLNHDEQALRTAYFQTRVVPSKQHNAAVKLLEIFASHLATLANQILIQDDNDEPQTVTMAKEFIRKHHTEPLTLPQVAKLASSSPYHFCKIFKRSTRLTFTQFVSRVRIESSKQLLTNPQLRISEVAFETGFQSLTHFNRVFQKILGQSPTEYRLEVQSRRALRA